MSETQTRTEVRTEQRIHAVEGAAPVNQKPNAPQHKAATIARVRTRVSDGKIGAVEGAATVRPAAPVTPAKPIISDEAAWEKTQTPEPADEPEAAPVKAKTTKSTSSAAISQLEKDEMKVEDETVAADESQPDIGWTDVDAAKSEAPKVEAKAKTAVKKAATTAAVTSKIPKAAKPLVTSKKPAPKAAPMPLGGAAIESAHGAVSVGNALSNEYDASPLAVKAEAKAIAKPMTTASIATSVPMEAAEILDTPDIAQADGPTDEQLSNWSGSKAAAPAAASQIKLAAAPAAASAPKQVFQRSAKASSLLEQLRARKPAGK